MEVRIMKVRPDSVVPEPPRLLQGSRRILTNSRFPAILHWFILDIKPVNRRYSIWSLLARICM
jgi:hypothetical protein